VSLYDVILRKRLSGKILDLSMSGCLVVPDDPDALQAGDLVEVSFSIHGFSIRVSGCIRHARADHSMGVEFSEGRDSSDPQIARLMQKLAEEWMRNPQQETRR
jgi:hypothetical protein